MKLQEGLGVGAESFAGRVFEVLERSGLWFDAGRQPYREVPDSEGKVHVKVTQVVHTKRSGESHRSSRESIPVMIVGSGGVESGGMLRMWGESRGVRIQITEAQKIDHTGMEYVVLGSSGIGSELMEKPTVFSTIKATEDAVTIVLDGITTTWSDGKDFSRCVPDFSHGANWLGRIAEILKGQDISVETNIECKDNSRVGANAHRIEMTIQKSA